MSTYWYFIKVLIYISLIEVNIFFIYFLAMHASPWVKCSHLLPILKLGLIGLFIMLLLSFGEFFLYSDKEALCQKYDLQIFCSGFFILSTVSSID